MEEASFGVVAGFIFDKACTSSRGGFGGEGPVISTDRPVAVRVELAKKKDGIYLLRPGVR
jgi:hypothetical protein